MQVIENIFSYINNLGSTVTMPIILVIFGLILGAKFGKALRGGLIFGVGFIGLNLAVGLIGTYLAPAVQAMSDRFGLTLTTVDIGWPAAAAIAMGTTIGALIIPIGLIVNIIMLVTKTTQTIDVDVWNYWHFAFTGSLVAIVTDNLAYGVIAAVINIIIVFVIADYTAPKAEEVLGMPGVSLPHGFTAAFVPFAIVVNWIIDKIPGVRDIDINIEKLQKKFGVFGEPVLIGTVIGIVVGILAGYDVKGVLEAGIYLAAALVLIPKMAALLMEGLMPISEAAQAFISKRFSNVGKIYIGLDSAVGVGHPITLTVSLILVPVAVFLAVILPGNTVLPMTDLSVLPYMFVLVVPLVNGNGFRALITGIVCLVGGLYISTDLASVTTKVAHGIGQFTDTANLSSICDGANPLTWLIYRAGNLSIVALIIVGIIALALAVLNGMRIRKAAKADA
jgi:PTS system galactitol-specific IIC component